MDGELTGVKTVRDCEEIATVDAHDDSELAAGWMTCVADAFSLPQVVKVFGEEVDLIEFDQQNGNSILGTCRKKRHKANIGLDSIQFINASKAEMLWIKAFLGYYKNW